MTFSAYAWRMSQLAEFRFLRTLRELMKIKPEDAGLFEVLDRILDQGIAFEAWMRLLLPSTPHFRVSPVYVWTYLHFGELA